MTQLWTTLIFLISTQAFAGFSNYNSILIGDAASGMGGAYVALIGDAASASYYNPASNAFLKGSAFSASANLYNKYDTSYSSSGNSSESTLKLNRGSFQSIPSAAGKGFSFGTFSAAISIITPDYNIYSGDIKSDKQPSATTFLNYKDQSLWVGGNLSVRFTDFFSSGITYYYTSRDYNRSVTDQNDLTNDTVISFENKTYTSNNVVYVLGFMFKIADNFRVGASYRPPSVQLSGDGSYYKSVLDTRSSRKATIITKKDITAQTIIPPKLSLGFAYQRPKNWTISFQTDFYGPIGYQDMIDDNAGEQISHVNTTNYSFGGEYFLRDWVSIRGGVFTNFSSHPSISANGQRQSDNVNMQGFSANICFYTDKTSLSFGGYYTGGKGEAAEQLGQQIIVLPKTQYIYSMLVSSSYYF